SPGKDRRLGTRDDRIVRIQSLGQGPDPNSVVLLLKPRLYAYVPYEFTIRGQMPGAVADLAGNRLDGDHDGQVGGDYVRRLNRGTIAGRAVDRKAAYHTELRSGRQGSPPRARRLSVPAVLGHRGSAAR